MSHTPSSILLVDDNPANIQIAANVLSRQGFNIEFALNGHETFEWTQKEEFDLILLDVMMPGIDGFEVCRQLKNNPRTARIPVIFINAKTDSNSIENGYKSGGVDYIIKPFREAELLNRIQLHLNLSRLNRELSELNESLEIKVRKRTEELSIANQRLKEEYTERIKAEKALRQTERNLLTATIHAEEKERTRFAQEIHDGIGPLLSTIQMYFQWLADDDENKEFVIKKGNEVLTEAIQNLREISNNLSPHMLHNLGLNKAIASFVDKVSINRKIDILYKNSLKISLNKDIELIIYRVITELINNTLKHAGATQIRLNISNRRNTLQLEFSDNGKGFDLDEIQSKHKGQGLFNIQNRISSVDGECVLSAVPGNGMKARISIPQNGNRREENNPDAQ